MASIRKRTLPASGKVVYQCDYRDQSGNRRSKQFDRKKDADAFLVKARHEVSQGTHTADSVSVTVAEAGKLWIERCEMEGLEASTVKGYREHLQLHIEPLIGAQKLSRLTVPSIEAFKDELLASRSRDMARRVLTSVKGLIKEARRRGLVAQNAAEGVTVDVRRSEEEDEGAIPSKEQIRSMLVKAPDLWPLVRVTHGRWVKGQGHPERRLPLPWRPLLITAVFTGMRASELRGLTWSHADLGAGVIRVRQRADRWQQIGPPKSRAGRRDIPLAPMAINALKEWKLACPVTDLDLVFPNDAGGVLSHTNLLRQGFYPLLKACGLWSEAHGGDYTFHSLRHAAASLFIEQGWSPKKIQTVMGHSSIQVTFDIYGHLFPSQEDDQAAMAQLQARLFDAKA